MREIKNQRLSQLEAVMSSVDLQEFLLNRAKTAVLQTAVELIEDDMWACLFKEV